LLERLFVEERRRLKIIPNGFGEKPVLKPMFGTLIRAAERWRGLRFTEFDLRQIAAVRKDLDAEYDAKLTPPDAFPANLRLDRFALPTVHKSIVL
jgi:putative transposase